VRQKRCGGTALVGGYYWWEFIRGSCRIWTFNGGSSKLSAAKKNQPAKYALSSVYAGDDKDRIVRRNNFAGLVGGFAHVHIGRGIRCGWDGPNHWVKSTVARPSLSAMEIVMAAPSAWSRGATISCEQASPQIKHANTMEQNFSCYSLISNS